VTHIAESLGIGREPLIKRLLGHADGSVTAIYVPNVEDLIKGRRVAGQMGNLCDFLTSRLPMRYDIL
jgi:hypothetical protein